MNIKEIVLKFLKDVISQNETNLGTYFSKNAIINWHNTNERFTPNEYIRANCDYPGKWCGEVEKLEIIGILAISVTRIYLSDNSISLHVTSFIKFYDDKIITLDEYFSDDGVAPQWRLDKKIGKPIK